MADYPGHYNYLREELEIDPHTRRFCDCLEVMEKYPNPWWYELRGKPDELAAKQVQEPIMLIRVNTFRKGLQIVLGRKVTDEDLGARNKEKLMKEFFSKFQGELAACATTNS